MYYVVICKQAYQGPMDAKSTIIFKKGDVYQAEDHGREFRVWRNRRSFLKFEPSRFRTYFKIFC